MLNRFSPLLPQFVILLSAWISSFLMKISIKRAYTDNIVFYTIDVQNSRRFFPLPSKQNHSFTILVSFFCSCWRHASCYTSLPTHPYIRITTADPLVLFCAYPYVRMSVKLTITFVGNKLTIQENTSNTLYLVVYSLCSALFKIRYVDSGNF